MTSTTGRFILTLSLLGLLLTPRLALASSITYTLDLNNCTGGCGTAPFVSVNLTETGANLDVVVSLLNADLFIKAGGGVLGGYSFMFNGVGIVEGDISVAAHTPTLTPDDVPFTKADFGTFGFGLRSSGGNGSAGGWSTPIVFSILNANIANLTVPNQNGYLFAADVRGDNGYTGAVYGGRVTTVPDGGVTMGLLGATLAGLGMVRRKVNR